jgi:SAM-dependent methyltransferase
MQIVLVVILLVLLAFAVSGPMGAPWVPTFKRDVSKLLDDAGVKPGQRFIELGCGDGRLVAGAASRGAVATGYEINPLLWLYAVIRNLRHPNAHIRLGNFWSYSLKDADIVVTFLMPKFMPRLQAKARSELKPGSRLISYVFQLPDKKPKIKRHHWFVYLY